MSRPAQTSAGPVNVLAVSPLRAIDGADAALSTAGLGADDILLVELREARAAVAELVEAAGLALSDHEMEGIELNHDTVTCLRAALAKFGGA